MSFVSSRFVKNDLATGCILGLISGDLYEYIAPRALSCHISCLKGGSLWRQPSISLSCDLLDYTKLFRFR